MPPTTNSWNWFFAVLLAAVLGYAIAEFREWRRRVRERRGHFEALAAELQLCATLAEGYLKGNVQVPTYRMPTAAYDRSFSMLLADGVLRFTETHALLEYYINVRGFNLAVDQAQALITRKPEDRSDKGLEREVNRVRLKAKRLQRAGEKATLYPKALAVLSRHLPASSLERLTIDQDTTADE